VVQERYITVSTHKKTVDEARTFFDRVTNDIKVLAVEPLVVDGDLGGGAGVQRVEQFGVIQEHRRLVLFGGDGVVDIRKADALGELAPKLKDPIRPDTADGDGVLYGSWYGKLFLILL